MSNPAISMSNYLMPNPFKVTNGSAVVRVFQRNHGLTVGRNIRYTGVAATGLTHPTDAELNSTLGFTVTAVPNDDVYYFNLGVSATDTDTIGGDSVMFNASFKYSLVNLCSAVEKKAGTEVTYSMRFCGASSKDAFYTPIVPNNDYDIGSEKWLLSSENESASLSNVRSLEAQVNISSFNDAVSPIVDMDGTFAVITSNRLNTPSTADINTTTDSEPIITAAANVTFVAGTGGTGYFSTSDAVTEAALLDITIGAYINITATTSNNSVGFDTQIVDIDVLSSPVLFYVSKTTANESPATTTITEYITYASEIAPVGGTAESKYQHIPVVLDQISTGLKIMFSSSIPTAADFDVYYRTAIQSSSFLLEDQKWTNANATYKKSVANEFIDQEYDINGLPSFNAYQVKIVMRSTDSSQAPKFKDLRVIALA